MLLDLRRRASVGATDRPCACPGARGIVATDTSVSADYSLLWSAVSVRNLDRCFRRLQVHIRFTSGSFRFTSVHFAARSNRLPYDALAATVAAKANALVSQTGVEAHDRVVQALVTVVALAAGKRIVDGACPIKLLKCRQDQLLARGRSGKLDEHSAAVLL